MQIIVGGAGRIGAYLTQALIRDGHSVTVVDGNYEHLQVLGRLHDIATRHGSITDASILEKLFEERFDLFIAVTDSEDANIVSCTMAKKLGNVRTIARLKNKTLLRPSLGGGSIFHIDHFVIPELLVAEEMNRNVRTSSLTSRSFFSNSAELRVITIPTSWRYAKMAIHSLKNTPVNMVVGAILRQETAGAPRLIIPHGNDVLLPGDQIVVITESATMGDVLHFFDIKEPVVKNIFISGGGSIGVQIAQLLSDFVPNIHISDTSLDRCRVLAKQLPHVSVLHQTVSDWDFLREYSVGQSDWYIGSGMNEERNTLTCLLARELGCAHVMACINDEAELRLAEKLGLSYLVSERMVATNHIIPWVYKGSVQAVLSLFGGRVEVYQLTVEDESPFIGIPLSQFAPQLPSELLIALIYSQGKVFVASGDKVILPGDQLVILSTSHHREFVETIF